MKYFQFTNYFNAVSPILEDHEEEIFFTHPTLPGIKCNQLGALYVDETIYVVQHYRRGIGVESKEGRTYGTKTRLAWECYRGRRYEKVTSPYFWHLNGNPLDCTPDNLFLLSELAPEQRKQATKARDRFVTRSVTGLKRLEDKYLPKGLDLETIYQMFYIPLWLSLARKREAKKTGDHTPTVYGSRGPVRIPDGDVETVLRLRSSGWTIAAIVKEMGWKSKHKVKRILAENKPK